MQTAEAIGRYWAKVDRREAEECWPWRGALSDNGGGLLYGNFWDGARYVKAHRFGFELAHGPIPPGLLVRHTCDYPRCQNPAHWLLGTDLDNCRDKIIRGRAHYSTASRNRGDDNPNAVLTEDDVSLIRDLWATGDYRQADLASRFGTTQPNISLIVNGRTRR